jgi:hypothetical protein
VPREDFRLECYRNPCSQSRTVCNAAGVCVVHPSTKNSDDVKSKECQALLRDKWGTLCKGKEGAAQTACEDAVDAAVFKDSDEACKAARAALAK